MLHQKTSITLLFFLILSACTTNTCRQKLLDAERCLNEGKNDSVYSIIESIDKKQLTSEDDRMLFRLLDNSVRYVASNKPSAAELQSCVDYYAKGNEGRLGQAYFYLGVVLSEQGDVKNAIANLKHAEHIAIERNAPVMQNKIYEALSSINCKEKEYARSLHYAKLDLDVSLRQKNNCWIAYAYNYMAINYANMAKTDSAVHYMQKSIKLLKYVPKKWQSVLIDNYITICVSSETSKLRLAAYAYSLDPSPSVAASIAAHLQYKGENKEAEKYWKQALGTTRDDELERLLNYYIQVKIHLKEYSEACEKIQSYLELEKELSSKREMEKISTMQAEYDRLKAKQQMVKNVVLTLFAIVLIVLLVLLRIFVGKYRYQKMQKEIVEKQQQIVCLKKQIKDAEKCGERNDRADKARRSLNEILSSQMVQEGKRLYDEIVRGGTTVTWKKKQYICYLAYFWTKKPELGLEVRARYRQLTPRQEFYVAVKLLYSDPKVLERIMSSNESALRTMDTRIRQQEL